MIVNVERESKEAYFLKIAGIVATRATCPRRSVGCVITDENDHIQATGYNGVPKRFPHCTITPCGGQDSPSGTGLDSCMATHAEANALVQCRNTSGIYNMYLTCSPCIACAKLIANTSCRYVYFSEKYTDTSGIELLEKLGVTCYHVEI